MNVGFVFRGRGPPWALPTAFMNHANGVMGEAAAPMHRGDGVMEKATVDMKRAFSAYDVFCGRIPWARPTAFMMHAVGVNGDAEGVGHKSLGQRPRKTPWENNPCPPHH